jgi:hypothetical protein
VLLFYPVDISAMNLPYAHTPTVWPMLVSAAFLCALTAASTGLGDGDTGQRFAA